MDDNRIPIWLDCDPGHDDAFAILLAAYHPRFKFLGISTTYGNAPLTHTTANTLSILAAIGQPAIPVFPGAAKPFCRSHHSAPDIHGESGLDGTLLLPTPTRLPLTHCNAILEMRDALLSTAPNTAWLCATGPLTNIALLFALSPNLATHLRGLSIMGGCVGGNFTSAPLASPILSPADTAAAISEKPSSGRTGNVTPYAEFNIHCDAESAASIFSNTILARKTVLIPLDLTHQVLATNNVQELLLHDRRQGNGSTATKTSSRLRRMFHELLTFFQGTYAAKFGMRDGPPLHDPLAVAVILSDICSGPPAAADDGTGADIRFDDGGGERWDVEVELEGEQVGRTRVVRAMDGGAGGVIIPRSLDLDRFWEMVDECLGRADEVVGVADVS